MVHGIGETQATRTGGTQENREVTGRFAAFKVRVADAFGRVGEAFRTAGQAIKRFFTSLFSMSVRQEPTREVRSSLQFRRANESLAEQLRMVPEDPSAAKMKAVEGIEGVSIASIFDRDLLGNGRFTLEGEPIVEDEDRFGHDNHAEKVTAVVRALVERFGPDVLPLASQYAHQGTFAALDMVLAGPDTPIQTRDGTKVFPLADRRPAKIDFSMDEDGAMRITFSQVFENVRSLQPVSGGMPVDVPGGVDLGTSFDIVMRPNSAGGFDAVHGPLRITGDLGV